MRELEWRIDDRPVDYPEAVAAMEARVAAIRAGTARELVWLLEHPPLYTAGTSARDADLLEPERFPVYRSGRGGQFTYHGPGQRVAYVMLDLKTRGCDVRGFVRDLEDWMIATLARFNVEPDLTHFEGIVPCGIQGHGITSLVDLGLPVTMADAVMALRAAFEEVFEIPTGLNDSA